MSGDEAYCRPSAGGGARSLLAPRLRPTERGRVMHVAITVNGVLREADVDPRTLLVDFIRDHLGLTGTKIACDTSQGLASNGALHAVQEAFHEKHGLQCGFCTPGMIMAAVDLLARSSEPTDEEIRHGLEGNLCRCTGYENIVRAVHEAAEVTR